MEDISKKVVELTKKALKIIAKKLRAILMIITVIIILACSVYYMVVHVDASESDDDWSSVPFGASAHASGVTINQDGTITNSNNIEDTWEQLDINNSRVSEYLDSPAQLEKLINAELVTQMPDTRPNPDDPIEWEWDNDENWEENRTGNTIQGIIKFKRADSNGNTSTLKYASRDDFYTWIEQYNMTGDEAAKNKALSHFTIKQNRSTNGSTVAITSNSGNDPTADISEAIVRAARSTVSPGSGLCQKWVREVYANAGLENVSFSTAYEAYLNNCISEDTTNIPVGAAVYGTGTHSAGHVGIYIGKGQVMDNVGTIKTQTLEEWIGWQERRGNVLDGKTGWLGWGWQSSAPATITEGSNDNNANNTTTQTTTSERTSYSVEVATWTQVDTVITSTDPNPESSPPGLSPSTTTSYNMQTTSINYQQMVDKYTMPFDLLWAFLVVGEDKDFIMDFAELAYNSQIEITVHDNYQKNTDIDTWTYTKDIKKDVKAGATAGFNTQPIGNYTYHDETEFEIPEQHNYETVKTVITQTNTLVTGLTKANVWYMNYQQSFDHQKESSGYDVPPNKVGPDHQDFKDEPDETNTTDSYSHEKVDELCNKVKEVVEKEAQKRIEKYNKELEEKEKKEQEENKEGTEEKEQEENDKKETEKKDITVNIEEKLMVEEKVYSRYINIVDNITNTVDKTTYISQPAITTEKTDSNSTEPNFVTIFNKEGYSMNRTNILSVDSWLFEILENNDSTANMVDLIKYILYKATNVDYGVTTFNVGSYSPGGFTGISGSGGVISAGDAQATVWYSLINAGYSEIATAAVMGNIYGESGWNPDLIERGSGIGFGLIQWSYGRRTNLEAFAASRGALPSDINIQVEYLLAELTPGGGADGYASYQLMTSSSQYDGRRHSPDEWVNATDIGVATQIFCYCFERPNANAARSSMPKRANYAQEAYNTFHGTTAPATSNSSDGFTQYYQGDYGHVVIGDPKEGRTVASSGCGYTAFSMVATALTGQVITPVNVVGWCGATYHTNQGLSWSFYQAAATHYGFNCVDLGNDINAAVSALQSGQLVISSQDKGLFTDRTHVILLSGIDSNGGIAVKDPNKGGAVTKGYNNRTFSAGEISAAGKNYWAFSK